MEELNFLKKLERMNAPPDFEQKVMAQLSLRKRKQIRLKHLRVYFAGAAGSLAVVILVISLFILPQVKQKEFSGLQTGISPELELDEQRGNRREIIPIIEAVDYKGEIRAMVSEPPTIYILEHVLERTDTTIKY